MGGEVEEFRIAVADAELEDLRRRLQAIRWPEAETVDDWSQGVPLAYLRELCAYWADGYDWRSSEARLNRLAQNRTVIDGLAIHFVHVRSPVPDATPLVMTHGWPGSIVEFEKVIGPLSDPVAHGGDPADAFDVVCPAPPGYGFSEKPTTTGWGIERIAEAWVGLMARLGYERFGAQGSDWGTSISACIGAQHPDRVIGLHLVPPLAPPDPATLDDLTAEERAALASLEQAEREESGYSRGHATRPRTIGYVLVDSPVALAAWVFWAWTDHDDRPDRGVDEDRAAGQPDAVLADRLRGILRSAVLGEHRHRQPVDLW